MKSKLALITLVVTVFSLSLVALVSAQAPDPSAPLDPQAALGSAFTYQGQLKSNGAVVTGTCDFQFSLWDAVSGGMQVATTQTATAVTVTNGLFTVPLDFGSNAFTGEARWLNINVRCPAGGGTYTALTPRQPLTPAPNAVYAANSGALRGNAVGYGTPITGQVLKWDGLAWSPANDATGSGWSMTGNAGTTAANFIGTTDNQTLTLAVNSGPALRLVPNATSPNLIGGYGGNFISSTLSGGTIGGGGASGTENRVRGDFGTIGGGANNAANSQGATVSGGQNNQADGNFSFIGGGIANFATGNQASVAGGVNNFATGSQSFVGGGYGNVVTGTGAFLGGGGYDGTHFGGNQVLANAAVLGGGLDNVISPTSHYSIIGGGYGNIVSGTGSFIGGGGYDNPFGGGNQALADAATIVGGSYNTILAGEGFIGGGRGNRIKEYASGAVIDGGLANEIGPELSTIGGGAWNEITVGRFSVIGGGADNVASNFHATVAGGMGNVAGGAGSFVGGGGDTSGSPLYGNDALATASMVGGGVRNVITPTGAYGVIGGGYYNSVEAPYGTVPGGAHNTVAGNYALAAGYRANALHNGTFVWADSSGVQFPSTAVNQFLVRASNGMGVGTNAPAGQLHVASNSGLPQIRIDQLNSNDYARLRLVVSGSTNYWDIAGGPNSANVLNFFRLGKGDVMSLRPDDAINYLTMANGARLTAGGAWTNASDQNLKANFSAVDSKAILEKVAGLPITSWNYKAEDPGTRHLGPMAQDFYAAFNLGSDDKSIGTVDESGVALAAIQGLYQIVQEKDQRISQLEAEVASLKSGSPTPDQAFNPFNLLSVLALGGVIAIGFKQKRGGQA